MLQSFLTDVFDANSKDNLPFITFNRVCLLCSVNSPINDLESR